MAKEKAYNNYAEVVGNVCENGIAKSEKTGELRFNLATHRKYTKKDGTKGEETQFLRVLVRPGRKFASQEAIVKGAFIRVKGHLENNSYKKEDGSFAGGIEINADAITVIPRKEAEASATEEPAAEE